MVSWRSYFHALLTCTRTTSCLCSCPDTDSEYVRKAAAAGITSGVVDGRFDPNSTCTIEQAIAVACRSLNAGGIGWYQYVKEGSDWLHYGDRIWVYFKNSQACCMNPYGFESAGLNLKGGGFRPIKDR